jgi:hypothetical protein
MEGLPLRQPCMEREMSGPSKPDDRRLEEPDGPGVLPELPELDPVPEDDTPADHNGPLPDDVPFVPPPGTQ